MRSRPRGPPGTHIGRANATSPPGHIGCNGSCVRQTTSGSASPSFADRPEREAMRHLIRLAGFATALVVGPTGTAIAAHASEGAAHRRPWTVQLARPQPAPPAVSSFYPVVYQPRPILRSAR